MKAITIILGIAFLIITGVMINLVRSGGALKPAGLIKPAELGDDPGQVANQIATRMYPEFDASKNVTWRVEAGSEYLANIPQAVLAHHKTPHKPTLQDLRGGGAATCLDNCWYIQNLDAPMPAEPTTEIFVQHFDRDEKVPEACENEKILKVDCMRPLSVREVHRKIKTPAPHYFMQRYLKSEFFLFIEKQASGEEARPVSAGSR